MSRVIGVTEKLMTGFGEVVDGTLVMSHGSHVREVGTSQCVIQMV